MGTRTSSYDFDLHGVVGVRLLDATPADLQTVLRQLGPVPARLDREPDLTIRFVDRISTGPLTYVAVGETAFDDRGFYVLQGRHGVPARAELPLADVGRHPEIVCERAVPAVPHLLAIVNLTALTKNVLPLHASAFSVGARSVLVTGWAKSGKTETLLSGVDGEARYVGDEWVYLSPDGRMVGVPEPIRVWGWHLDQLPHVRAGRPRVDRWRLGGWRLAAALAGAAAADPRLPAARLAGRLAPSLRRQAYLRLPPEELFGAGRIDDAAVLDAVVLLLSAAGEETTVSAAGATEVSARMAASLADERAPFLAHYRQYRYAFPDRVSPVVEAAPAREAALLAALFDGRPAARVRHPYPCDLRLLGATVWDAALTVGSPAAFRNGVPAS